jgi:hypothetical protein
MVLSVVRPGRAACAAAHAAAGEVISSAGAVDHAVLMGAAAALGPFGAGYRAGYGLAQASHLSVTAQVGRVYAAVAGASEASSGAYIAADEL